MYRWAALVSALLVVLAIYWPALSYPFVQDDWCNLSAMEHRDVLTNLREEFNPVEKVYYRPLGMVLFLSFHGMFGSDSRPVHLAELLMLVLNAALVAGVARRLGYGRFASWAALILFAAAVPVHLDTVLWMSGLFDLAGVAFFLASLLLFLRGYSIFSAAVMLLGLLCKESLASIPFILLLGGWVDDDFPGKTLPAVLRRLWPHFVVLAAFLTVRSLCLSPFALPEGHPYQIRLFGLHLLKNAARYVQWSLEAVSPFRTLSPAGCLGLAATGLLLLGVAWWRVAEKKERSWRRFCFLAGWYGLAILPVLFLADHRYRYFLIYSLPALILFLLEATRRIADRLCWAPWTSRIVVVALLAANVVTAVAYFRGKDARGLLDPYTPGTNHLIHRGHAVMAVQAYLARSHPTVPHGTVFVIDGVDLESFDGAWMFRVLYKDLTLQAVVANQVQLDPEGAYQVAAGSGQPGTALEETLRLDPERTVWLEIRKGQVTERILHGG